MPVKAISWRFGWDNDPEILRYLGCVQHALWNVIHNSDDSYRSADAAADAAVSADVAAADAAAADGD